MVCLSGQIRTNHQQSAWGRLWLLLGFLFPFLCAITAAAEPSRAQAQDDPAAYVRQIYVEYPKHRDTIRHSPRLEYLLERDKKGEDPIGRLDFDPITNSQDASISEIVTKTLEQSEKEARVQATFKNYDETNVLIFSLERGAQGWMIGDISALKPEPWTLSRILEQQ